MRRRSGTILACRVQDVGGVNGIGVRIWMLDGIETGVGGQAWEVSKYL